MNLTGRVALVTGGVEAIGAATVLRLAEAGADVVLHFQRARQEAESVREQCSAPERIVLAQADLREKEGAAQLIGQVHHRFERLDYLIHNAVVTASGAEFSGPFRLDDEVWDEALAVNLRAPVEVALRAAELMQGGAPGSAAIVQIGSATVERGEGGSTGMVAAQGAIPNLTRHLAQRLAPAIRVNAVLAGLISGEGRTGDARTPSGRQAEALRRTPMARMGTPEEVAELIEFLLAGTTFITGQVIVMDGGMLL